MPSFQSVPATDLSDRFPAAFREKIRRYHWELGFPGGSEKEEKDLKGLKEKEKKKV